MKVNKFPVDQEEDGRATEAHFLHPNPLILQTAAMMMLANALRKMDFYIIFSCRKRRQEVRIRCRDTGVADRVTRRWISGRSEALPLCLETDLKENEGLTR